jgi:signal transduction histidine kinase
LGLSISFDIVKAHGGEIKVESCVGEFTEFTLLFPVSTTVKIAPVQDDSSILNS